MELSRKTTTNKIIESAPTAKETAKTEALAAMQKATTIKDIKAAFAKYAEADGITLTQGG